MNQKLIILLQRKIYLLSLLLSLKSMKPLVQVCKENLGIDVTPDDLIPDMVACAITASTLINKVDATFPKVAGTWSMWDILEHRKDYIRVTDITPGTIIISPTDTGNGKIRGHVGIYLEDEKIASNDSMTGKFIVNFTTETWKKRYVDLGGFKVFLYRKK